MFNFSFRPLRSVALALCIATLTTGFAMSQDTQPEIKFNFFEVNNLVISDNYTFGKDYGEKYGIPIPAPFRLKVPRQDNVTPLFETGTEPNGMIIKINFATGNADTPNQERQLIENLQFIPMTLPMDELEARMQNLTVLMVNQAFPQVTANREQVEYIGARRAKIGDVDVIDAVGSYVDADLGLMYVRITGFAHPTQPESVYSVVNLVAKRYDITNLDQLFQTGSGKTISSFEYITE